MEALNNTIKFREYNIDLSLSIRSIDTLIWSCEISNELQREKDSVYDNRPNIKFNFQVRIDRLSNGVLVFSSGIDGMGELKYVSECINELCSELARMYYE